MAKVFQSVVRFESGFKFCLLQLDMPGVGKLPNNIKEIIASQKHFEFIEVCSKLLNPIADCIAKVKRRSTTLADCLYFFL